MRLTVFTEYSLRVLMVLASRTRELVTIADIAGAFDISHAHLMKVTHALGKTGWVETVRGRNGGMRLAVDPRKLKLGDAVRAIEEDFGLVECLGKHNRCVLVESCGLETAIQLALESFFRELDRYTLADLVVASPSLVQLPMWQPITWQDRSAARRARRAVSNKPAR
jgi:Rrf2 family nitric oxide-sensitive transcriptional repressor